MGNGNLQLLGPYDAWHGAAHTGRLQGSDGSTRRVLVLLGPESTAEDALDRATMAASHAMGIRHPGVLALLDVRRFGDRIAWVYEDLQGLGLGWTVGSDPGALLSTRASAEVVADVATTLLELGADGWRHPGPEPSELLLEARGDLRIAGFAGPFPRSPAMRAPQGEAGEAALVYRLGVLLAHLVCGAGPAPASDRSAHGALVRRALIRAMARPGPVLTERYGDWIRGMLAWDPAERPPLSTLPDGLRKVGEATGGIPLRDWAAAHVERLRDDATVAAEERRRGEDGTVHGSSLTRERSTEERGPTEEVVGYADLAFAASPTPAPVGRQTPPPVLLQEVDLEEDDPTQEAPHDEEVADSKPPIRVTSLLPMPVQVGPPPEAVRSRPSLPPGFLEHDRELTDPDAPVSGLGSWWAATRALWIAGGVLGALALLLLLVNLALWARQGPSEEPAPPDPSIAEVIAEGGEGGEADPERFAVTFRAPEGEPIRVTCGEVRGAGVGAVSLESVPLGTCTVTGEVDGQPLATHVSIAGPATLRCFVEGEENCR